MRLAEPKLWLVTVLFIPQYSLLSHCTLIVDCCLFGSLFVQSPDVSIIDFVRNKTFANNTPNALTPPPIRHLEFDSKIEECRPGFCEADEQTPERQRASCMFMCFC